MTVATPPAAPGFSAAEFGILRAVGVTRSPFALSESVYVHPGAAWEGAVSFPPMRAAQAAAWSAFLAGLDGMGGTFYFSPPDRAAPFGTQTADFLVAAAAAARATSIDVTMTASATLLAGDRISIADRIHEVIASATADGAGAATLSIRPGLRDALTGGETVKTSPPRGIFRLTANDVRPERQADGSYALAFAFREVL